MNGHLVKGTVPPASAISLVRKVPSPSNKSDGDQGAGVGGEGGGSLLENSC